MKEFTLLHVFKGFIKNYKNFNIKLEDSAEEINNKEMKYFIILGQMLGFNIVSKKVRDIIVELNFEEDKNNKEKKLTINRENNLVQDVTAIENLISSYKEEGRFFIEIIETSSEKRIEYLNNLIIKSNICIKNEILVIYIIKDILNYKTYFMAYLFNNNKIIDNKLGYSYKNNLNEIEAILRD